MHSKLNRVAASSDTGESATARSRTVEMKKGRLLIVDDQVELKNVLCEM